MVPQEEGPGPMRGTPVQMNKDLTINGAIDDVQPSTSTAIFGDVGYIRRIGAALGLTLDELSESAIDEVNNNVSYVLRNVIAGSLRFAQHSRRSRILPEDIDAHLAFEKKPALFGFKPREMIAIRLAGSGGQQVYVEEDKEIKLNPIFTAAVMKIPPVPTIRRKLFSSKKVVLAHWLAIDGEQPAVPENPNPTRQEDSTNNLEAVKEDEAQDDANRLLNIVRGGRTTEQINIKATTTHTLTLEQQVYYKEVTEAIMGGDDQKRTEALHSLKTDTGIQTLVGRFSVAVAEGVRCNIVQHNLAFLIYLMRLVQSLVSNSSLSLDKWLHEFLPSILSCILSKQVCARPEIDNHWALREFGGRLIVDLCRKQGPDIQSRVIKVLTKAWMDVNASMSTIYGALYTLDHFGPETIRTVVVPMIPALYNRVQRLLTDRSDNAERVAAEKINNFTNSMLISYVKTARPSNLNNFQDYSDDFGGFADNLYKFVSNDTGSLRPIASRANVSFSSRPIQNRTAQRAPTFVTQSSQRSRVLPNGNHQSVRYSATVIRRPQSSTPQPPGQQ